MNPRAEYWSEFIEGGEATVCINLYQKFHLLVLTKYLLRLQRKKVSRNTIFGSIDWNVFELIKRISKVTSPRANDIFWFWVESRWAMSSLHKNKIGVNAYEYRFVRKKYLSEKDIKMNFKSYKAVNELRNHI